MGRVETFGSGRHAKTGTGGWPGTGGEPGMAKASGASTAAARVASEGESTTA